MPADNQFYIEEYKSIRQEIDTKLKDRSELTRWGLVGLAALYSYILSNPGKSILFWVPVFLSLAVLAHFRENHKMVHWLGAYIREHVEPWAAGGPTRPMGWEVYFLGRAKNPPQEEPSPNLWEPLWLLLSGLTVVIALGASTGLFPWLLAR